MLWWQPVYNSVAIHLTKEQPSRAGASVRFTAGIVVVSFQIDGGGVVRVSCSRTASPDSIMRVCRWLARPPTGEDRARGPVEPPARGAVHASRREFHARIFYHGSTAKRNGGAAGRRLREFAFVRHVGRGTFGDVCAVRATRAHGADGPLLALKVRTRCVASKNLILQCCIAVHDVSAKRASGLAHAQASFIPFALWSIPLQYAALH
jgi:hypothetical protein